MAYGAFYFCRTNLSAAVPGMMQSPEEGGLGPNMMFAFFFSLITFTIWYITLMGHRIRLERLRDDVEHLKERLAG